MGFGYALGKLLTNDPCAELVAAFAVNEAKRRASATIERASGKARFGAVMDLAGRVGWSFGNAISSSRP